MRSSRNSREGLVNSSRATLVRLRLPMSARAGDAVAIDVGAVGAVVVQQFPLGPGAAEQGVAARDQQIVEDHRVLRGTPDADHHRIDGMHRRRNTSHRRLTHRRRSGHPGCGIGISVVFVWRDRDLGDVCGVADGISAVLRRRNGDLRRLRRRNGDLRRLRRRNGDLCRPRRRDRQLNDAGCRLTDRGRRLRAFGRGGAYRLQLEHLPGSHGSQQHRDRLGDRQPLDALPLDEHPVTAAVDQHPPRRRRLQHRVHPRDPRILQPDVNLAGTPYGPGPIRGRYAKFGRPRAPPTAQAQTPPSPPCCPSEASGMPTKLPRIISRVRSPPLVQLIEVGSLRRPGDEPEDQGLFIAPHHLGIGPLVDAAGDLAEDGLRVLGVPPQPGDAFPPGQFWIATVPVNPVKSSFSAATSAYSPYVDTLGPLASVFCPHVTETTAPGIGGWRLCRIRSGSPRAAC